MGSANHRTEYADSPPSSTCRRAVLWTAGCAPPPRRSDGCQRSPLRDNLQSSAVHRRAMRTGTPRPPDALRQPRAASLRLRRGGGARGGWQDRPSQGLPSSYWRRTAGTWPRQPGKRAVRPDRRLTASSPCWPIRAPIPVGGGASEFLDGSSPGLLLPLLISRSSLFCFFASGPNSPLSFLFQAVAFLNSAAWHS